MVIASPTRLSVEEYLAWEERNLEKHEYIDGEIRPMAGARAKHSRTIANINTAIGRQLDDSDCFLLSSDMRVQAGYARYVYPDLCAVCGEEEFARDNEMELLNPVLVIEVTTPRTMDIDRGEKRALYLDVPSIETYLIIDQHRVCAELSLRSGAAWHTESFQSPEDVVPLDALGCRLPLAQVYRGISFDPMAEV